MKIKKENPKKRVSQKKFKFEKYKNCLEATQLGDKKSYLGKNGINVNSPKKALKELKKKTTKNNKNKLILKSQQRLKNQLHNNSTEKIIKIALISNNDKRMQSIDSIKRYEYGTSKVLVIQNEEMKCDNIFKKYKSD